MIKAVKYLFLILGVSISVFGAEKFDDKSINSFSYALNRGLKNIGVETSVDEIQAYIGTAFSPAALKSALCISKSIRQTEDFTLTNLLLNIGLKENRYYVGEKVWSSAIARQFLRSTVREALLATNIVLVRGGWPSPAGKMDWGVVESIDGKEMFVGETRWGKMTQKFSPEKIIIFSMKSESVLPNLSREKVLKAAARRLNKSIFLQVNKSKLLTGCDLIDFIANRLHRKPFCPICKDKSYLCFHTIVKTLYSDFGNGTVYLNNLSEKVPDYMKTEIKNAAEQMASARDLLSPYLNENDLKIIMRDRKAQAKMAEKFRKLKFNLTKTAENLALACSEEVVDVASGNEPTMYVSKYESKRLARSLPLFSRINGLRDTFFISATIAAQMLGIEKKVEWLKGVSGLSFRFLIDTNTFTLVTDIADGYDCMESYLRGAGLVPTFNSFDIEMPVAAESMIRKDIIETINKRAPIIISAPGTTGKWGIITGYEDYGLKFLCRLPYDTNYFFSKIEETPDFSICLRRLKNIPTERSQVKTALQKIIFLSAKTNFSEYVSGEEAINYWIGKCAYYSTNQTTPPAEFAKKNEELWLELRNRLKSTYRFLDIAISIIPEIAPPLTVARNTYVNAVDLMNITYADKNILRIKNDNIYPSDWSKGLRTQIDVLNKVNKIIEDANLNIKNALKQINNK